MIQVYARCNYLLGEDKVRLVPTCKLTSPIFTVSQIPLTVSIQLNYAFITIIQASCDKSFKLFLSLIFPSLNLSCVLTPDLLLKCHFFW